MKIDPLKGWHRYTELMNAETDPKRKAMLNNMRFHLKYECLGDHAIFDSMIPNPDYRFYPAFGVSTIQGMGPVKEFYYNMWDNDQSLVELKIDYCAPADWGVACAGEWLQQVPGKTLIADGNTDVDPDAWYISHAHLSWFFPFEEIDGKMLLVGEICYIDGDGATLTKLDDADVLTMEEAKASWAALDAGEWAEAS